MESRTENNYLTQDHIKWLGFEIEVLPGTQKSGIVCRREGFKDITRNKKDNHLYYDLGGSEEKKLVIEKDINDIVIPKETAETYFEIEVECPHCGENQDRRCDLAEYLHDGELSADNISAELTCEYCHKEFEVERIVY